MTFFTFRKTSALLLALCLSSASVAWAQDYNVGLDKFKKRDYAGALKEWQPLADRGGADAQYYLGWMYVAGYGVQHDYAQALVWFRKAADQGHVEAQYLLGRMYNIGRGVKTDIAQAIVWFRKAAEQGHAEAQRNLDQMNNQLAKEFAQTRKAAEQGDAEAQISLGKMYENGHGVQQDKAEAANWYIKAFGQGNALALFSYTTLGAIEKDDIQAVARYRKAAEQGDARAQNNLGVMYRDGRGVQEDDAQAVAWYRKAAGQGFAEAQNNLGQMYYEGRGVQQDDVQAVAWYRKAADQGHSGGQTNLGWMHEKGRGVHQDDDQALVWYRKAVNQGDTKAKYYAGKLAKEIKDRRELENRIAMGALELTGAIVKGTGKAIGKLLGSFNPAVIEVLMVQDGRFRTLHRTVRADVRGESSPIMVSQNLVYAHLEGAAVTVTANFDTAEKGGKTCQTTLNNLQKGVRYRLVFDFHCRPTLSRG